MIKLFQKFAEFEAEPHFNARASALAIALQKYEALLRIFGQSQSFPNVGKDCALSPLPSADGVLYLKTFFKIFVRFPPFSTLIDEGM